MSKPEYQGKDFFQRSDFRGLLLADYQEAIGEKAFDCVEQLNQNTVSKFSTLKSFRESLSRKKTLDRFYKSGNSIISQRQSKIHHDDTLCDDSLERSMMIEEKATAINLLNNKMGINAQKSTTVANIDEQKLGDAAQILLYSNKLKLGEQALEDMTFSKRKAT